MIQRPILVINTGNTSTKVALFDSYHPLCVESLRHSDEELAQFKDINSQEQFREQLIQQWLEAKRPLLEGRPLVAVAARGGLLRPLESGTYLVNEKMLHDLREGKRGMHASHLSAQAGFGIATKIGVPCYIVDPISVDEYEPIARLSGHKLFERVALSHALNMKAVAKRYAREKGVNYNKITLIVVHLGSGISVSIHKDGRMIDGINSSEEGPFSPDRSGSLPSLQVARYCLENKLEYKQFSKMIFGDGGLYSYLNTKEFLKAIEMYNSGNPEAITVVNAMAYQVAKEIGAMATVNDGHVDDILITGGMAYSTFFVDLIKKRVAFIAPVLIYPGEDEMEALAEGICRVLDHEEEAKLY